MQCVTIDLDHKARLTREKIHDEVAQNDLTPERDAETLATNGAEEKCLGRSRIALRVPFWSMK